MISKLARRIIDLSDNARALGLAGALSAHAANFVSNRSSSKNAVRQTRISGLSEPIFYRPGTSDWPVLQKIFMQSEYEVPSEIHERSIWTVYERLIAQTKRPVIIDCGANIGLASLWFANKFPGAIVIALEPEPGNFEILLRNVQHHKNIISINAAISDREGRVSLSNASAAAWAWETRESDDGPVRTLTISDLLSRDSSYAPLIVKIDIEGFEAELFRSNTSWADALPAIVFESHDGMFPWRGTAQAILSVLLKRPRDYLQKGETIYAIAHSGQ